MLAIRIVQRYVSVIHDIRLHSRRGSLALMGLHLEQSLLQRLVFILQPLQLLFRLVLKVTHVIKTYLIILCLVDAIVTVEFLKRILILGIKLLVYNDQMSDLLSLRIQFKVKLLNFFSKTQQVFVFHVKLRTRLPRLVLKVVDCFLQLLLNADQLSFAISLRVLLLLG